MMLTECEQLPDFTVISRSTLHKWRKKSGFCYMQSNKKYECINDLKLM